LPLKSSLWQQRTNALLDLSAFSDSFIAQRLRCGPDTVQFVLQLTKLFFEFSFFTLACS